MTLDELRKAQTSFVLQRAQAKDTVENCERSLGQVAMAINALEDAAKALIGDGDDGGDNGPEN